LSEHEAASATATDSKATDSKAADAKVTGAALSDAEMARLREIFEGVHYARFLGMRFVGASRGEATVAIELREELTRHEGLMHGGALASLLDTASAFAVLSTLAEGERTVTVDLTIHYLRPVLAGEVTARARVLRKGRRIATLTIEATDSAGALAATAITTYAVLS
jgi:uncharacterized protein (TIGR00369 family)